MGAFNPVFIRVIRVRLGGVTLDHRLVLDPRTTLDVRLRVISAPFQPCCECQCQGM